MKVQITLCKKPKASTLICGLPGIAFIGKLAVDYLIRELNAELIGEVYSPFFSPYVLINKNGIVELLRNELYYFKDKERGIYIFTGNAQAASPEGQYEITNEIMETVINFGVKRIYSIAAYITNKPVETPKVYGITTSSFLREVIKEYGVKSLSQGIVRGTNGLILGLAKIKEVEGICLLGETLGYQTSTGQYLADVKAVKAVLEVLTNILDIKVDMEPLDRQTEQMDELIMRMMEIETRMRDEIRESVEKKRTRYIT